MLPRRPWLKDANVAHDCENNIVTIQQNGMVITMVVTKHLRAKVKILELLLYHNGIIDEENDIIFAT
jgi:hypothetical protein